MTRNRIIWMGIGVWTMAFLVSACATKRESPPVQGAEASTPSTSSMPLQHRGTGTPSDLEARNSGASAGEDPGASGERIGGQAGVPRGDVALHILLRRYAEQLDQEATASAEPAAVRKRAVAKQCRTRADEAERQAAQGTLSTASAGMTQLGPRPSNPQKAALEDGIYYRRLADQLREMAGRERIEAEAIAESPNRDPRLVTEKRQLAEHLAASAAEVEQRARQEE